MVTAFFRRVLRFAALALVLLALGLGMPAHAAKEKPSRIVAVGDVHCDYEAFVGILREARLLDANQKWVGGDAVLVQTGDFLDRGPKCRPVMDLLMSLEAQAPRRGGRVVVLLGNHEVMNLMGDLRYVTPENFAEYADGNSEKRRRNAFKAFREHQARTARGPLPPLAPGAQQEWMEAHPPGYFEHREAFDPNGKYGRWLRQHAAMAKVGETVFLHAGISPVLSSWKLDALNARIREELLSFDNIRQFLVEHNVILPWCTLSEAAQAAQAELDKRKAEAAAQGSVGQPTEAEKQYMAVLESFLGFRGWFSVHPEGPLWFRGFAQWSDQEGAAEVDRALASQGAARFVVGHTVQAGGRIRVRWDGKVFLIDTGMLSSHYQGGRASALEIAEGRFTAIYPGERVALQVGGVSADADQTRESGFAWLGGGLEWQEPVAAPATPSARHVWKGPDGTPLPFQTDEEVLAHLRTAKVVSMRGVPKGITQPRKCLLEKDGVRSNAVFRDVDEDKAVATLATGERILFFRDSYIFEPAAYELARLLGMDNVPPAVVRRVYGKNGSIQIFLENAMTEEDRIRQKIRPPDAVRWNQQVFVMRVFDNLVANMDRNAGNILIDKDWKLWLIDHTRAFHRSESLREPDKVRQCERKLFERLKALNPEEVKRQLKPYLRTSEIDSLLKRRDKLVALLEKLIEERGEEKVLFSWE